MLWTTRQFGEVGRLRYEALLTTALSELCEDPDRLGAKLREDMAPGVGASAPAATGDPADPGTRRSSP